MREKLKLYRSIVFETRQIERQLGELVNLSAVSLNSLPSGGVVGDSVASYVCHAEELQALYAEKIDSQIRLRLELEKAFEVLTPHERAFVRSRYFDGLSWMKMCKKYEYSENHVYKINAAILNKLEKG